MTVKNEFLRGPSSARGTPSLETHRILTHETFLAEFIADLSQARGLVLIQSPFITVRRVEKLKPFLKDCLSRGIRVCVFGQLPKDKRGRSSAEDARIDALESATTILRALGVHVTLVAQIHEKVAVIDESIFWDGSLNILSHFDTAERMTRWVSRSKVTEAISLHGLNACAECPSSTFSLDGTAASAADGIAFDLAKRRKELGLTQQELAARARVAQYIISSVESGRRDIQLTTLERLAKALGLSLRLIPWYLIPSTDAKLVPTRQDISKPINCEPRIKPR